MSGELSIWNLVLHASVIVQAVLVLLLLLSLMSWAIIFNKWRLYRKARLEAEVPRC